MFLQVHVSQLVIQPIMIDIFWYLFCTSIFPSSLNYNLTSQCLAVGQNFTSLHPCEPTIIIYQRFSVSIGLVNPCIQWCFIPLQCYLANACIWSVFNMLSSQVCENAKLTDHRCKVPIQSTFSSEWNALEFVDKKKTGDSNFTYIQRNSKKINYLAKGLHKKDA